ncbi:DNA polymerase I, partial [Kineococcus sp. T13]|nr:DNA polymerase I [Kineococcus vitellinus]
MDVPAELRTAAAPGADLALVVVPAGLGLAVPGRRWAVPGGAAGSAALLARLEELLRPRWTWWAAA